ncbi:hypothetical protein G7Z17_g2802 [Cylindrodendrum hubeiense]|uniref:Protein kinase domain-containing protein n=1 Tax=Cylindrodendrum hubeiense TaxID=595255 RepID=A0A9P5HH26_9HYPO|nr:hypothetical protein G7Z17_g2802 [Cylindrodendrum hubeiense]
MNTETESQGWDTRFADSVGERSEVAESQSSWKFEPGRILQEILIAVRHELPFIQPEFLEFNSRIGQGSSFEVNKELFKPANETTHFVAVKHIVLTPVDYSEESRAEMQAVSRRLASVMREVRVLTHPKLRSHSYLVAAIAWGWILSLWGENQPLIERRWFALDVAMGLRTLHDCNIVHGDVKPESVLVYDYPMVPNVDQGYERHHLAKLVDFGCALFEQDFACQDQYYLGSPKYNAPEICGRIRGGKNTEREEVSKFEQFKAADCYSFGLLLWETVKNGKSFIEPGWLNSGEDAADFLERVFQSNENALLDLAIEFFRHLQANSESIDEKESMSLVAVYPSNPTRSELFSYLNNWPNAQEQLNEVGVPPDAKSFQALQNTVSLCLQDKIWQRGSIHEIVNTLSQGAELLLLNKGPSYCKSTLNAVPFDAPPDASHQLTYAYGSEDMFKAIQRIHPPWYNLCEAANHIQRAVNDEQIPERRAQAHLQLAVMYHVGYGLAPDRSEVLRQLEAASENNEVARAIFSKVRVAFNGNERAQEKAEPALLSHITYKNPAILHDSILWRDELRDNSNPGDQSINLGSINVASFNIFAILGTPIHWAVMAGYADLVKAFIHIGANVNARNQWRRNHHDEVHPEYHPSLSPLDLAVACHFPQIVEILLDHGSEVYGGDWYWLHSPFHMIGYDRFPFARYMAHGQRYRAALQETLRILIDRGLDINVLDSHEETPLLVALKNLDLEPYVLEEMLSAGAVPGTNCEKEEGNIVMSVILGCAHRRFSGWKIPLLLPYVQDINTCTTGKWGLNALHYCATLDALPAVEALLRTPGINLNAESAFGATAVSLAAQRGSLDVLDFLISKGADIHKGETMGAAISAGKIDVVAMLINTGAGTTFQWVRGPETITLGILHYAVQRSWKRPSYVRICLDKCPQLHAQEVLDEYRDAGWTPLHEAAYYGDVEGVRALLEAGADPLKVQSNETLSGRKTPLELPSKTLEEATLMFDGKRLYDSHPRTKAEVDGVPKSEDDLRKVRRIEIRFMDCLAEIMDMLRGAELERRLDGLSCPSVAIVA